MIVLMALNMPEYGRRNTCGGIILPSQTSQQPPRDMPSAPSMLRSGTFMSGRSSTAARMA
jgi:hypothetical protein